jgi:ribosomal protein L22
VTGRNDTAPVRAQAKFVRTSARKARLVLDHVRGRSVPEARTILAFTPRAVAAEIDKVLRSAVANAEANHGLDGDELIVVGAFANEGPTMKRWRARARGRVNRIRKRTCHITIELAEDPEAPLRPRRSAETPAAEQEPPEEIEEVEETEDVEAAEPEAAAEDESETTSPTEDEKEGVPA